jgi:hypothetical protein
MGRPVRIIVNDHARYDRLEQIAKDNHMTVEALFEGRGVDLLLENLDADLSRAAAALVAQLDWGDLGKITAIIGALQAVKAALPKP